MLSRGRERLIWRAVSQWLPEQAQVDRASPRLKQTGSLSAPGKNARLGRRGFDRTADRCGVSLDAEAEADSDCIAGLIRPKCAFRPAERPPGAKRERISRPKQVKLAEKFRPSEQCSQNQVSFRRLYSRAVAKLRRCAAKGLSPVLPTNRAGLNWKILLTRQPLLDYKRLIQNG